VELKRQIGLAGGIAMVVGGVIGMGAFVLIPIICAKAGGAAWLSVSIALITSLVSVFPLIQLSSAYPVAGGGYEYGRKFISPFAGILFSWWSVIGGAAAVALVAYGLVESFKAYLPSNISMHILSILLLLIFFVVYLSGIKFLMLLQVLMSVQMLLALLFYTIPVLQKFGGDAVFTLPQNENFFMAIVFSFNICLGFQIIMELGEEMENPKRNIPLSLIIGAAIILGIYLMTIAAYSGIVGQPNLSLKPEMVGTAIGLIPKWAIIFIRIGIISAGLTCFNGAAIAIPREIFAQARAGILPEIFSRINKNGTPQYAVSIFFVVVCLILLLGELLEQSGVLQSFFGKDIIEFYGFLTIFGMMTLTIGISIAAWKLPSIAPELYQNAYIRFSKFWLAAFVTISILSSLFLIILVSTKWLVPLVFGVLSLLVWLAFKNSIKAKQ
jgi:APA family basic amino acid/polyamine antiporter